MWNLGTLPYPHVWSIETLLQKTIQFEAIHRAEFIQVAYIFLIHEM